MKTQKVEIEIPVFDGMEFLRIGIISRSDAEDADIKVCSVIHQKNGRYSYGSLADPGHYIGLINIIYRKKRQRRIIYEENSKHDKKMNMLDNIIYYLLLIVILMCLLVFFLGFINILDDI